MLLCNVLSMDDEDMEIDRLVGRLDLFLSFHGFASGWLVRVRLGYQNDDDQFWVKSVLNGWT